MSMVIVFSQRQLREVVGGAGRRMGHINGKYNAGCVLTLTEIGGGAPLLTLFEKWLAELLAL